MPYTVKDLVAELSEYPTDTPVKFSLIINENFADNDPMNFDRIEKTKDGIELVFEN